MELFNQISAELACYKSGRWFTKGIDADGFDTATCSARVFSESNAGDVVFMRTAKATLIADLAAAKDQDLPSAQIKGMDTEVVALTTRCYPPVPAQPNDACLKVAITATQNEAAMDDALAAATAKKASLATISDAFATLYDVGIFTDDVYASPDHKASIVVSARDVLTTNSTSIGTVAITWQGSNFIISTGVLLSGLRYRTYANTPDIVNGTPVLDSSGKNTTTVTESDTVPSVVAPLALASYELAGFKKCRGRCGFLVSAGLGANLYLKTADYAAGISFRYRDTIFTPLAHIGRETFLTDGVYVGEKLGSGPPALPTANTWTAKFGLAITYRIPII